MKRNGIKHYTTGIVLLVVMFMGQSGIISMTLETPSRIQADTLVGSGPFIEGLELIAAENEALIAQYVQFGGEKRFPFNPYISSSPFDNLDALYIVSSNQENWDRYWPRSIWEFRDGGTVALQFSQGMQASLDDAAEIVSALNPWLGTTLDVLYGVYEPSKGQTTLFYWGYMTSQNHTDFIYEEFYNVLESGGFTNFITNEVVATAPVSAVATGIVKNETGDWVPLAIAGFILEDGIAIDNNGVHNMSIDYAFNYLGTIRPAPDSILSAITFKLPYVANVYDMYPETDNLYPELTGEYNWILKFGQIIDRSHEDIYVTYDMAIEELQTFPQITGDLSVDVTALHRDTDPILNYTLSMTNTGDETAYDTTLVWDLGERPESESISIFDSDTYKFNTTVQKYYNTNDGLLYDNDPLIGPKILIMGWFTYHNGTIVQPESSYIPGPPDYYMIDLEKSIAAVNINKTFLTLEHSSNLYETTLENGNFALVGMIDELNAGSSQQFWCSVTNLPSEDDTFLILGGNATTNETITPDGRHHYNVTFIDNTTAYGVGNNLKDLVIDMALAEGSDLRIPSLDEEFIPGVMFRYEDSSTREYFGWSNGLVVQLYDDEAILKTTVSLNSSIYRIDDIAEITLTIENIGDANATNVAIQGFHAQLGSNWELAGETKNFTDVTWIGTIEPGETKTETFTEEVHTFLGLHPVAFGIRYTTEESEGFYGVFNRTEVDNLVSNLLIGLVLPEDDKAGKDEPSYPTPRVNVVVSWIPENEGETVVEVGDVIEIRIEVTNMGDEATTIKISSYFPTRMAHIDISGAYNGETFKVTDESGNTLTDYDFGFAEDNPDWPISGAAVAGLHLAPDATVIFYYKIVVDNASDLIVPPVEVEYDSRYPMVGTTAIEETGGEESDNNARRTSIRSGKLIPQIPTQQNGDSRSSWSSHSQAVVIATPVGPDTTTSTDTTITTTTTSEPKTGNGINGFTTMTSFIRNNMLLMITVLALPIMVLLGREYRSKKK